MLLRGFLTVLICLAPVGVWGQTASFVPTGSMNVQRTGHTATLLTNGLVLVTGGEISSRNPTNTAELYDPVQGRWRFTKFPMNAARAGHSATLLRGGAVLIAGGFDANGNLGSAEIFDLELEQFTTVSSLQVPRRVQQAVLLNNGKVLVMGGYDGPLFSFSTTATAELFDPNTRAWSPAASMPIGVVLFAAARLLDGKVLVTGGESNASFGLTNVSLYDPSLDTWRAMAPLLTGRQSHTATTLADGKVLIVAGNNRFVANNAVEVYDPSILPNGQATPAAGIPGARVVHQSVLLGNGRVLVIGGQTELGFVLSAKLFDPTTGSWADAGTLNNGRAGNTATLLPSGQVLVAGGVADSSVGTPATNTAELWVSGTALPAPAGLAATVGNHRIYLYWNPPPREVDGYNVYVEQFEGETPVLLGTVNPAGQLIQETNATVSQLPDGTFVANGILYRFAAKSVVGGSESEFSNKVLARAGEFAVSQIPRPDNPILFVHGVCLPQPLPFSDTGASAWDTTADFLRFSLGWTAGGVLAYPRTSDVDPRLVPPLLTNFNPNGHFFTSTFGNCEGTYKSGRKGLSHQGDEIRSFLATLSQHDVSKGVSIVAHSMGGVSARSYLADYPGEGRQRVKELITYGSPHWGIRLASANPIVVGDGGEDLKFDCRNVGGALFLDYSGNVFLERLRGIVLPDGIRYFAIRGQSPDLPISPFQLIPSPCFSALWDGLIQIDSADFNGRSNPPADGQRFPSSAPPDQQAITPQPAGVLTTGKNHLNQTSDFSAILCALEPSCAILQVKSPVEVEVTNANGQKMTRDFAAIPGASYMDITENDGHKTTTVLIPFPEGGQYTVKAIPKPDAQPTDTFTITLTQNGVTTTIADHIRIQDIPPDGFHPHVNSRPFANAGANQTVECTAPNGTLVTLNGSASGDQDGDPLTHQWTDGRGIVVGNAAIITTLAQMGTQTYTLTVTDPSGFSATAQTHVTVRDTTPPTITASLVPAGEVEEDEGLFQVVLTCSDKCDASPQSKANINGVPVTDGQVVKLELEDEKQEVEFDDGRLKIEAPSFLLTVTCSDASGNSATATAAPPFVPEEQEEHKRNRKRKHSGRQ